MKPEIKVKCLIVDDEPLAIKILTDYVSQVPFLELVASYTNPIKAIKTLREEKIELLFLDIEMDELTGIQLLKSLTRKPIVIFTTAFDSYALEGYDLNVTDYLLKPISFERFIKAIDKAVNQLNPDRKGHIQKDSMISNPMDDFLFVKTESKLLKVFFKDIFFVEGQGDYLMIHTEEKRIMTLQNFTSLEKILPTENFIRVHRSYVVAFDKIESIERNRIIIKKHYIPISQTYKQNFDDLLKTKRLS